MPPRPPLPHDAAALVSAGEWQLALRALGDERARELLPMLREVSPAFRRRFFAVLAAVAGPCPHPPDVALALARAVHELKEEHR